ncbi:hypothetical protein EN35_04420 [Rhodococcus qingshengii]|nr:hypothetical protein EN35_04420 [Rhodococcus qingshengii]
MPFVVQLTLLVAGLIFPLTVMAPLVATAVSVKAAAVPLTCVTPISANAETPRTASFRSENAERCPPVPLFEETIGNSIVAAASVSTLPTPPLGPSSESLRRELGRKAMITNPPTNAPPRKIASGLESQAIA